nr:hypothetical protein [Tanacetum cinerariifolium]
RGIGWPSLWGSCGGAPCSAVRLQLHGHQPGTYTRPAYKPLRPGAHIVGVLLKLDKWLALHKTVFLVVDVVARLERIAWVAPAKIGEPKVVDRHVVGQSPEVHTAFVLPAFVLPVRAAKRAGKGENGLRRLVVVPVERCVPAALDGVRAILAADNILTQRGAVGIVVLPDIDVGIQVEAGQQCGGARLGPA